MSFIVTKAAMRPASDDERCFYCQQAIGQEHKPDCVNITKKGKVRMVVEYEIELPNFWTKRNVEFHRNHGSWCGDNVLDELSDLAVKEGCLCEKVHFEYLGDTSEPFLKEK
jgi:hypothetical protein